MNLSLLSYKSREKTVCFNFFMFLKQKCFIANTKRFPFHESEWIRLVIVLAPPQNHISSSNDLLLQFITFIFILYLLDFFLSGLNWVLLYFLLIILALKMNSYYWFGTLGDNKYKRITFSIWYIFDLLIS
jgi:hypothetical protein